MSWARWKRDIPACFLSATACTCLPASTLRRPAPGPRWPAGFGGLRDADGTVSFAPRLDRRLTQSRNHARLPGPVTMLGVPRERVLVTGSAGHLGEALVRVLREQGRDVVGLDLLASPFTTVTGPVTDRAVVRRCLEGVGTVLHAATLHKPHIGSHSRQDFVDTNVSGTLTLLEEAVAAGVESFVFTSSTSVFGRALTPLPGEPATWITEDVTPVPRNIYG